MTNRCSSAPKTSGPLASAYNQALGERGEFTSLRFPQREVKTDFSGRPIGIPRNIEVSSPKLLG